MAFGSFSSAEAPIWVLNMSSKSRGSVSSHASVAPGVQEGFCLHSKVSRESARKRPLQVLQSTMGSENPPMWPEAVRTAW